MDSLTLRRVWLPGVGLLLALLQTPPSLAGLGQSTSDLKTIANPARVVFQHDGRDVSGFALYLQPDGGSPIRFDLGPLKPDGKGLVSAPLPQIPPGVYRVEVAAYNGSGESPRVAADPPTLTITDQSAAHSQPDRAMHVQNEPEADSRPKSDDSESKKKSGVGRRFWKVLVGDDDKP